MSNSPAKEFPPPTTKCCLLYPANPVEFRRLFEHIVSPFLKNKFNLTCSELSYEKIDRKIIQSIKNELRDPCIFVFCYRGEIKLEHSYKLGLAHAYNSRVILISFSNEVDKSNIPSCINYDFLIKSGSLINNNDVDTFLERISEAICTYLSEDVFDFLYRKAFCICEAFEQETSFSIPKVDKMTFFRKFDENEIFECINNYNNSDEILLLKIVEDVKTLSLVHLNKSPSSLSTDMKIFVSYSHADKEWLNKLQTHLKPLTRSETIDLWDDTRIRPGDEWLSEIETALATAKIAILLVSPNFIASDFIANNELPPLLDAAQTNGVKILWIPVSYSSYKEMGFSKYQAAYDASQPLDTLPVHEQNRVLVQICAEIKRIATANDSLSG